MASWVSEQYCEVIPRLFLVLDGLNGKEKLRVIRDDVMVGDEIDKTELTGL